MSFIAPVKERKLTKFQLPKKELQLGILIDIIDMGIQNTGYKDAEGQLIHSPKVLFTFELPEDLLLEGKDAGMPLVLSTNELTLSMHKKANLRTKVIQPLLGKILTDEEASVFDLTSLLGKAAMLSVDHRNKKVVSEDDPNKVKAYIAGISPVHKSMKVPKHTHPLRLLDLQHFNIDVFNSLPKWLRKKINTATVDSNLLKDVKTEEF